MRSSSAAIVLAAGAATRMGKLKQLLVFRGQTLVQNSVQQAVEAGFAPVIVVVGAEAEAVRAAVTSSGIEIVHNDAWQIGMGSSIAAGVKRLQEMSADSFAAAILLADQPLVKADHLRRIQGLLDSSGGPVIAAQYEGTLGVPALFRCELFPMLTGLPPEAGARNLLRDSGLKVMPFPLPEAAIDIDTPEDFAALELTTERNS